MHTWLARVARRQDVVYFFFAGHGVLDDRDEGYFVAHDSDPQNLHATALSFQEVDQTLSYAIGARLVVLVADACHSGRLGWSTYMSTAPNQAAGQLEKIGQGDRSFLKLLAASPSETSYEDGRWNGGHGVFTNTLLQGLRGQADHVNDRMIRASNAIDYVSRLVPEETRNRQHPRVAGTFDPGIALAVAPVPDRLITQAPPTTITTALAALKSLVKSNRLLQPNGAWDFYRSHSFGSREEQADAEALVITALEDAGQACVGDYVQSTAFGLKHDMLQRAVEAFARLQMLHPDDRGIQARAVFCKARLQIAEDRFSEALATLDHVLKLDPNFACAYNALGVAMGRLGRKKQARAAFEKAAVLTPEWALPPFEIGSQLIAAGELANARPYLIKAVQYNPASSGNRWALLHLDRSLGRIRDAITDANDLIRLNPNYAPTYVELGLAYEASGEYGKAAAAFDAYLLLAPNFADSNAVRTHVEQIRGR